MKRIILFLTILVGTLTAQAETDFPDELIMNYWPDKFFDYLGIQR